LKNLEGTIWIWNSQFFKLVRPQQGNQWTTLPTWWFNVYFQFWCSNPQIHCTCIMFHVAKLVNFNLPLFRGSKNLRGRTKVGMNKLCYLITNQTLIIRYRHLEWPICTFPTPKFKP
jgi:hypothetical protein